MAWFEREEITTDWLWLDESIVQPKAETRREGAVLTIRVTSPYELPEAVRARHVGHVLFIEFKYLEDEKTTRRQHSEELYLHTGKHTGRVYRLEFDLSAVKSRDTRRAFDKIRDLAPPSERRDQRKENYQAVRRIVDLKGPQLAEAVGA
jgi:hypothetical protein